MPAPDILPGLRAPRSVRMEEMRQSTERAHATPTPASSTAFTTYVSKYRKYRVQVTSPQAYIDPASGRKVTGGKMLVAEFDEGVFRNNKREHTPVERKLIDESLQANPYFGTFGSSAHFWLASEQNAKMEAARVKSALETLKSLPREQVEQFVADLKQGNAEDHVVPPADPPKGSTIRPIQTSQ